VDAPARPAPPPFGASPDPGRTQVAPAPRTQSPVDAARAATAGPATGAATRSTTGPAQRHQARIRKARLRLLRVDPWSVMKTSFLLSIAAGAMLVVAVGVLWSVLDAAGVFSAVGDVVRDVTSSESSPGFSVEEYLGFSRVLGFSTLIAVIDVVLITALATLGAFLYNLSASLLGGLEVTLAEDD